MFGTMGYAAPEALGYYDESDNSITYTISVDIWAVGTIALTLLLGRDVFPSPGHLSRYVNQQRPLEFSRQQGDDLTDICQDFISGLLAPDPVVRPTAIAALAHPWLNQAVTPPPENASINSTQQLDSANNAPLSNSRRIKPEFQQEHQLATIPDINQELPRGVSQGADRIKREPSPDNALGTVPAVKVETDQDKKPVVKTETKPELKLYPPRDAMTIGRMHELLYLDNVLLARNFRSLVFNQVRQIVYVCGTCLLTSQLNKDSILRPPFRQRYGHRDQRGSWRVDF